MPRPSYLGSDVYQDVKRTASSNRAEREIQGLRWPGLLDDAVKGLRRAAFGDEQATSWTPLPIVVSDRPDAMQIMRQLQQPAPQAQPSSPSSAIEGPPDVPGIPNVSRFNVEDFHFENGESVYTPSIPAPELSPGGTPISVQRGAPQPTGDLRAYTRAKAVSLGIDPDIAERVAMSEGGFDDPVRQSDVVNRQGQREQSYGPFQMNVEGGLGATAIQRGHDPRDPANVYRNIDFALEEAARGGWGPFHGAARVGIGNRQGIGVRPTGPAPAIPLPEQSAGGTPITAPAAHQQGAYAAGEYTPNQITAATGEGLDYETALAVCGPAAAIAFARKTGRNPTMQEAVALAKQVGWTAAQGMAGPSSQRQLLTSMGIASRLVDGAPDWKSVAADVQRGNPVILSTPGHYFVAERYDPESGAFDFGNSAAVLKASGGRRWFKPEDLASLGMGEARASLFMDSPESPSPSVVAGRTPPNAGAAPSAPAAPLPSGTPAGGASTPPAGASPSDMVTIARISDGETMTVPRSQVPGWLKDMYPGSGPLWRVVEGAPSALDAARAGQDAGQPISMKMSDPVPMPGSVDQQATGGVPGLGVSERGPVGVHESRDGLIGPGDLAFPYDQPAPGFRLPPYGATDREGLDPFIDRIEGERAVPPGPLSPVTDFTRHDREVTEGTMYRQPLGQQPELPPDAAPMMLPGDGGYTPTGVQPNSGGAGVFAGTAQPSSPDLPPAIPDPDQSPGGTPITSQPPTYGPPLSEAGPAPPPSLLTTAAEGIKRAGTGLWEAVKEPQNVVDTLGAAAGAAGQAVVEEAYPTPEQQTANAGKLPMQRGLELIQAALDAGNFEIGRRIGRAAGLTDDEMFTIFGIPVSAEDVAGFAGSVVLDPTNLVGAGPVARGARQVAEAAPDAARAAGRAIGETFEQGRATARALNAAPETGTVLPGTFGAVPDAATRPPEPAPPFFSQLRRTIDEKMPNRADPRQVQGILRSSAVKPDEIAWTGIEDFLTENRGRPVTKQQVLDFLDQNEVRVEEVVKGGKSRSMDQIDAEMDALHLQGDIMTDPALRRRYDELMAERTDVQYGTTGSSPTKYGQYTLPGGENYRELLLTLPQRGQRAPLTAVERAEFDRLDRLDGYGRLDPADRPRYDDLWRRVNSEINAFSDQTAYRSAHWEEPNILAHVRFNEHVAPDGKRVLLIEEVQSDWHQAGRKEGYKPSGPVYTVDGANNLYDVNGGWLRQYPTREAATEAAQRAGVEVAPHVGRGVDNMVPDAPFKKTWPELAIKRMIRWAAENDFDRIAWPPGSVHAERYSLAQHVDDLRYITKDGETGTVIGYKGGQEVISHENVSADKLGDYVGQDAARKLFEYEPTITAAGDEYRMTGRDIASVGGEGMKGFYDQILPTTAQKIGKKFGARVGRSEIDAGTPVPFSNRAIGRQAVHSMDITPEMKRSVMQEGQPLFVSAGSAPSAPAPGSGALGAVNRAAGEVIAGGTGGAVIEQGLNPDDPNAAARGFAAGAVGFPVATRAARLAARAAGRTARNGGGTLSTLGDVPPRYRPELSREPVLPGMEPPPRVRESLPDVSEVPNVERITRGPERQAGITGMGDELVPPLERMTAPPTGSVPALPPGQTLRDVLPDMVRSLQPSREPRVSLTEPKLTLPEGATEAQREAAQASSEMRASGSAELPDLAIPTGVLRRVREATQPWLDRVNILRYAGMLSATASQFLNVQSNVLLATRDVALTPIAASLDVGRVAAMRAAGRTADRQVFFGEIPVRLAGMRAGSRVGLQPALEILRSGMTAEQAAKLTDQSAAIGFGTNIPGLAPAGSARAGVVDFAAESPLRALAASDAVFRSSATGGHLMAEAYASAKRLNKGREPTEAMLREAAKDPALLERVQKLAARSVLQEDRAITKAYQDFIRKAGLLGLPIQVEVPFVKTPYNVVAQGMGMTPAGLAGLIQDMGKLPGDPRVRTAREVEYRLANVALGTAIMAGAATSYGAGELTGPYPSDAKERSTLPPGWREWSRKVTNPVNGDVYYLPLSVLGPLAMPAVVAILAGEAEKKGNSRLSPEWAGAVAMGVGRYAVQQSFFEGVANVAKTLDESRGEAQIERQMESIASQFSPHIVGGGALGREIQRIMGMPARNPEGMLEALLATHPLTAEQVQTRQDVLGREQSMGISGPAGFIIRGGVENDAPVIRAFRQANEGLPRAPSTLRNPDTGRSITLTPYQKHRWQTTFGTTLQREWSSAGRPRRAEDLQAIEDAAREVARDRILRR